MSKPLGICLSVFIVTLLVSAAPSAKNIDRETPISYTFKSSAAHSTLPPEIREMYPGPMRAATVVDTLILASFDFDSLGLGSKQGWTSIDLTAQIDTYFHVAGIGELNGGTFGNLLPIEGTQSLWCGLAPAASGPYCGYATLPGYGNNWNQIFASRAFAVAGDVTFTYQVQWDSEPGYDWTVVEYEDNLAMWTALPVNGGVGFYDDVGELTESFDLISGSFGDSLRLRIRFTSDAIWSDEDGLWPTDGAILLDSMVVVDTTGTVNFQDFENESPGDLATLDGAWHATVPPGFGDFSALYSGTQVVQEDPCFSNLTFFWGWFDDPAITNYGWGGFPQQGVMRYGPDANGFYMKNEILSPLIPFAGTGDVVHLNLRAYRDMPIENIQFYTWKVRSWADGCPGVWITDTFLHHGGQKDWHRANFSVGSYIDPGATHIQFAIGALDLCDVWCGIFGSDPFHSHAPLIDDVVVKRIDTNGPQIVVRHIDLFQDNFAEDGTVTGSARADCALDINGWAFPSINPGDSIIVRVTDPSAGLAADPHTGTGPAVYAYVAAYVPTLPPSQAGRSGPEIESTAFGLFGKRYPVVDSLMHDGLTWYCFRMDSARATNNEPFADQYCFDLRDNVFTPGDVISYVICAENAFGERSYWSRRLDGQGDDFLTNDIAEALGSPCEFSILPGANGGNFLYVDGADDRGGPVELYYRWTFDTLGILGQVDRYDVLGPSSAINNTPASRVKNVLNQIIVPYRAIIWSTGSLGFNLIGDGITMKPDDFGMLYTYLDLHPDNPGLYLSGDNIAWNWMNQTGTSAINLRSDFMDFILVDDDHISQGEPVSPTLVGVGPIFFHVGVPDSIIAYGGCPGINDFDLLGTTATTVAELANPLSGQIYMLSQATANQAASTARVVLGTFDANTMHDNRPRWPFARMEVMRDILIYLRNIIPGATSTGIEETPLATNHLEANYPNPFNPVTTIEYGIRAAGPVSLRVYNVAGQLVSTLVDAVQLPRAEGFSVTWDGQSDRGAAVASGVYFFKLQTKEFSQTRKMVLLK